LLAGNRHRQRGWIALGQTGVTARQQQAVGLTGGANPGKDFLGSGIVVVPIGIDHCRRPPTHGGDVADVGHHRRPPGKPRRVLDEAGQHALDGQQLKLLATGNRRSVIAGQGVKLGAAEGIFDRADGAGRLLDHLLGAHGRGVAQGVEQRH
jgi:hypothetical protein